MRALDLSDIWWERSLQGLWTMPHRRGAETSARWLTPPVPGRVDFGLSHRGPPGTRANAA